MTWLLLVLKGKDSEVSMRYTTVEYSGIPLDTILGDSGTCYVTLTSLALGLGIDIKAVKNWASRVNKVKGVPVQVGKFRKQATAYPVDVAGDFLDYRISLGDKQALSLYSSTFRADVTRSIKEANGFQVTAAQHEEVRHSTRLALLQQWVKDNYQPTMLKNGVVVPIDHNMIREGDFENGTERQIVELEALIARRETYIASGKWGEAQVAQELKGIESYRKDIQTLAQSLSN